MIDRRMTGRHGLAGRPCVGWKPGDPRERLRCSVVSRLTNLDAQLCATSCNESRDRRPNGSTVGYDVKRRGSVFSTAGRISLGERSVDTRTCDVAIRCVSGDRPPS